MREKLLLDEMHSAVVATTLRDRGYDVIAVTEHVELRALSDAELFEFAAREGRRVVTENVRDFRPVALVAAESRAPIAPLLFTSSRTFPRSRRNLGPLIAALEAWLLAERRPDEDWLRPPE